MTTVQQLYDLQGTDEEIERYREAIASIDAALADDSLLLQAQQAVEESRATLRDQQVVRRDLELTVEASQERASQVERKLYGGTVRNPRELEDVQAELNAHRAQQRQQEEALLEVLEAVEETEKSLSNLERTLKEIEETRQREVGQLMEEREQSQRELARLEERRLHLSSLVTPGHLGLYSTLRSSRQGQAVVKVERGMCRGCRIGLPTRVVQLARTSPTPVQCPSCNRILYVS